MRPIAAGLLLLLLVACSTPDDPHHTIVPPWWTESPTFAEFAGRLDLMLAAREPGTYAGFCFTDSRYREGALMFTEDPGAKLIPYLRNQPYADSVEVKTADYTLSFLQSELGIYLTQVHDLGFEVMGTVDRCANRAVIEVLSIAQVQAALDANGYDWPGWVMLREVEGMFIEE